ncbi:MAG TPA: alpha/beta hydrolase [Mycobacterium sp.]|nr:alpha/beta hydrolase [Mycobacterium sp.]
MRPDVPIARHQTVQLPNGGSLAFRELPGPPGAETVVLLHGIGMTADLNWAGSFATLRQRFRVVAPDLRGHGRNESSFHVFRLEDCADDVVALADALGIERFIAIGYSMGGLIAQLLWRRHPERTSRLVLCACSRNFLGTPAERMASLFGPAVTAAVRMNPLWSACGAGMLGRNLVNDLGGEFRQFALREMNRTSLTTVAAALVAVSEFTSHEWIGQVDVPVTVLVTTRDTIVPTARQRRLAEAIPHSTMVAVDGDHGVCITDPVRFSAKLLEGCMGAQATSFT